METTAAKPATPGVILIVEDDPGLAELISETLQNQGWETARVATGAETLAWLAGREPALLLLDYSLPDMTGAQFLAQTVTLPPFVIATGVGDERLAVEMMKQGARDYLVKDRRFLEILPTVVKRVLAQVETERQLAQAQQVLREDEANLSALLENADDSIWSVDSAYRLIVGNAYFRKNFQSALSPAPQKGDSVLPETLPPEHLAQWRGYYQRALCGEIFSVETVTLLLPEKRYMEYRFRPIRTPAGAITGVTVAGRDITERKRTEEALKTSLCEKEVLLQEVHHRVKNNLQVICSLLDLQADTVQDPATLQALRDSQNRVMSMALVHEKLYRSKDLAQINFAEYITNMLDHLLLAYGDLARPIVSRLDVAAGVYLGIDKAIPCGLIINELVSNALKYAFPHPPSSPPLGGAAKERPEIRVAFEMQDGQCVLVVSDNGVGLPPTLNIDDALSLGLRLVKILTGQLHGTLEIERQPGTAFKLTFPENYRKSQESGGRLFNAPAGDSYAAGVTSTGETV